MRRGTPMKRCLITVALIACCLATPAFAEFSLPFGSGAGQVGFFNTNNHPDVEELVPVGPMAFRINGNEAWVADSMGGRVLRVTANGKVLAALSVTTATETSVQDLAIATDRKGQVTTLWVLDAITQQIVEMSPDGKTLRRLGGEGDEPGRFVQLHRIEIGKSGRLYVADKARQTITVLDGQSGTVVRERHWEWSGFCLDVRENLCQLKWDGEAKETHLIREDFDGKLIDDTILALPPHGNPELWWINPDGEAIITFYPMLGEGQAGPLTLARVKMSDGKVSGTREINTPMVMSRGIEPAGSGIWVVASDYAAAPKGAFAIKRLPIR